MTSTSELMGAPHDNRSWLYGCFGYASEARGGEADLDGLADEFVERSFAGGTYVSRRGEDDGQVHVVRSGRVELSRLVNDRRVVLQLLGPGDVFGDAPAFVDGPALVDARAVEDSVIMSLGSMSLLDRLQAHPELAWRWMVTMAVRFRGLQDRLGDLLAGSLDAQLASLLLRESLTSPVVALTQDELALMLGAVRTSVHRVLKQLEAQGIVERGYRRIRVLDRAGLAGVAGDMNAL